jgi:hypothetical protein
VTMTRRKRLATRDRWINTGDMPTTKKGAAILGKFQKEYGPKDGKSAFYATANKQQSGKLYKEAHNRPRPPKKKHGLAVQSDRTYSKLRPKGKNPLDTLPNLRA